MIVLFPLLFPVPIYAQDKITFPEPQYAVFYRPTDDVIEAARQATFAATQSRVKSSNYGFCSCVTYLESLYPQISDIGAARNWPHNALEGSVGGVLVLNESRFGHVALILGINTLGYIVDEANYVHCVHTMGRVIPFGSKEILGYWNP